MKVIVSVGAVVLCTLFALLAEAQEGEKSRDQLIAEALRAYNEGNYDRALDFYFEAKVIEDIAEIDYSIARCYHNLQKCDQARKFYEKTLTRISELPEGFAERVQGQLSKLESCVDPTVVVEVQPEKTPEPPPVEPEPQLPEEPSNIDWLSISIIGGGAAIALAGMGLDLGSQGLIDDHEKFSSDPNSGTNEERRAKIEQLEDDIATRKLVSFVLYGVGGAALATGVVLLIVRMGGEQEEASAWTLQPVVDAEGAGFVFGARF